MSTQPMAPWLTPPVLQQIRAVQPDSPAGIFDPAGNWTNAYRIWIAIGGKRGDYGQSHTAGYLVLHRRVEAGNIILGVQQKTVMDEGDPADRRVHGWHEIDAEIRCQCDTLATPMSWRVRNRFGRDWKIVDDLTMQEEGTADGDGIRYSVDGRTGTIDLGPTWTSDWSLFEAVQRMRWDSQDTQQFDMLEKLRLPKPNQVIYRNPDLDCDLDGIGRLRCVSQTGRGILPFDYWLDAAGRLRFVASLHVAWILDDDATAKTDQMLRDGTLRKFER